MAIWTALLVALLPWVPAPDRVAELLAEIRQRRDATPAQVFEELARARSAEALDAVERAADLVRAPDVLEQVYAAAARLGRIPELEDAALDLLVAASRGGDAARRLAATDALVELGDAGVPALRALLERSDDPLCRSTALRGVLPLLRLEGTPAALELLLDNWRVPESGSFDAAVRTVAGFRAPEHLRILERVLRRSAETDQVRALVLDALTRMPTEAADEALVGALGSDDPALQLAAIQALEQRGAAGHERELDALARDGEPEVRAEALIALARHVPDDVRWRRRVLLASKHRDPVVRAGAATVLGMSRFDEAHARLAEMLADEEWRVRSAALDACLDARSTALVPLLIARLDAETRGRGEAVRETLVRMTARDHGASSARWGAWWQAEGHAQPLATPGEVQAFLASRPSHEAGAGRSSVQFFGIPVTSERVAFVIDSSGSMLAATGTDGRTRIDVAKAKLVEVLERLAPEARFTVVWFASAIDVWRAGLRPRTARNLRLARRFVEQRDADGGTALYDGLVAAWRVRDVEEIYLLTDGQPSAGRIVDPGEILADVRSRFARRPVTVHCVAVGTASTLLEQIAELTGGVYRKID